MTQFPVPPLVSIFISLGVILMLLCGIIAWTYKLSIRINKFEDPKFGILFGIAFVQTLLGVIVTAILRAMKFEPFAGLGAGIGTVVLSGILILKLSLQYNWKQTLQLWGIAGVMQLVLIPICLLMLSVVFFLLLYWIYPPVF
jgi:hypothetical protein